MKDKLLAEAHTIIEIAQEAIWSVDIELLVPHMDKIYEWLENFEKVEVDES